MRDPLSGVALAERLARQLAFCIEVDKVKQIVRRNLLTDGSRGENDAEHMWHLALLALVLGEYSPVPIDLSRVLAMVLVHDLVEIDAGDAFVYDPAAREAAATAELAAAERIFGLLPEDQAAWMRAVWDEFEAKESAEARFAGALDRLQPLLMNATSDGGGWAIHHITADRVVNVNSVIELGSPELWSAAQGIIARAVADGVLLPGAIGS